MKAEFWLNKWQNNEIGFHNESVNPALLKHFNILHMNTGDKIFVPLCGKTLDIKWFINKGIEVVGVELSEVAIEQLFKNLDIKPTITNTQDFQKYQTNGLEIWVGDFFKLTQDHLGFINSVYDRAALVALPFDMRSKYAAHLRKITNHAPQLLVTLEFDQDKSPGPPFSISDNELKDHYPTKDFHLECLDSVLSPKGLKGKVDCSEKVWYVCPSY
ncbi:MAG: thiopurine S-methyltransferase [Halobacteriovoraceae bacterium]|nr:thiopurine S-methyltransferase [Halobacteriovoraceae bacterium]